MMVNALRCTVTWRPTTSSAPAKCSRQNRWLMTATGPSVAAALSSAGVSIRPRTADTPSTSKKRPLDVGTVHKCALPPARQIESLVGPREGAVEQIVLTSLDLRPDRVGPRSIE